MNTDRRYLARDVEVSEVPTIPPNVYLATLDGVTEEEHELYGTRWVWHWQIPKMHPDDGGVFELQVWSPPRFSSTGIASEMARALGFQTTKGAKVSLGALRGRQAQLTVILDEEKGRNRVKAVTPAPAQAQPVAAAVDPEYAAFLAEREAKKAAIAAANAQEPPLPEPAGELPDDDLAAA